MDFKDLAKSWMTSINPTQEEIDISELRIDVCNNCEYRKDFIIQYCSICKCPLQKKIYTSGTCPIGKWTK